MAGSGKTGKQWPLPLPFLSLSSCFLSIFLHFCFSLFLLISLIHSCFTCFTSPICLSVPSLFLSVFDSYLCSHPVFPSFPVTFSVDFVRVSLFPSCLSAPFISPLLSVPFPFLLLSPLPISVPFLSFCPIPVSVLFLSISSFPILPYIPFPSLLYLYSSLYSLHFLPLQVSFL